MRSLIEDEGSKKSQEIEIPSDGISLDLLRAVYRNSSLALTTRMRAAIAALPHEVPRLAVTAQIVDNDIAALLDQRIARYQQMQSANDAKLIEAQPITGKQPEPKAQLDTTEPAIETKSTSAPLTRVYYTKLYPRRF
jgi:phage portal protein BeeE